MKLINKCLLNLLWVVMVLTFQSSYAAEETFLGKLRAQEEREYKELIDQIKTMSDADYAVFLNDRVDKGYAGKTGRLPAIIVVDVTEQMNQPEPNFLVNLFGLTPEEKDYGINKIESILTASDLNKSGGANLSLKDQYQSKDKQNYFQRLEGTFTQQEAKVLVSQPAINDFYVMDTHSNPISSFVTTHTPTGRILPPPVDKQYDMDFINAGLYDELIRKFEATGGPLMVEVSFHLPSDADDLFPSQEVKDLREKEMDDFLNGWLNYEFQVYHKGEFYVLMTTTRQHVEAMKADSRVNSIRKGNLIPAIRSSQ